MLENGINSVSIDDETEIQRDFVNINEVADFDVPVISSIEQCHESRKIPVQKWSSKVKFKTFKHVPT